MIKCRCQYAFPFIPYTRGTRRIIGAANRFVEIVEKQPDRKGNSGKKARRDEFGETFPLKPMTD